MEEAPALCQKQWEGPAAAGVSCFGRTEGSLARSVPHVHASASADGAARRPNPQVKDTTMASIQESLNELLTLDGALCSAIVDSNSGMLLGSAGSGVDMELAAAGNTEVVRAKMKTMKSLGLNDSIDDILITLGKQYHIIRPVAAKQGLFTYLVIDKQRGNLALARRKAQEVEQGLTI